MRRWDITAMTVMRKMFSIFAVNSLFLLLFQVYAYAQNEIRFDSLFYLNGNIEVVKILKNQSESIDCNYIGEDLISTINKSSLHKIVFKSGRIEICNKLENKTDAIYLTNGTIIECKVAKITENEIEYTFPNESLVVSIFKGTVSKIIFAGGKIEEFRSPLNVKEIFMEEQWEDVIITYNIEDTRGLERVAELSEASGWGGVYAAGVGYNNAIAKLKHEAASKKCGLVYIVTAPNARQVEYGAGVRVNAIAYRIPRENKDLNMSDDYYLKKRFEEEAIQEFYNGKILQHEEYVQEKKVDVFEKKIKWDYDKANTKEDCLEAEKEYKVLQDFLNSYGRIPMWAKRTLRRIESSRKEAYKRIPQ